MSLGWKSWHPPKDVFEKGIVRRLSGHHDLAEPDDADDENDDADEQQDRRRNEESRRVLLDSRPQPIL